MFFLLTNHDLLLCFNFLWMRYNILRFILSLTRFNFQVGMCETGSDSFNSNISPLCTPNEYILQSYFAKHQHLLDSDFQDFIAKNLPSCTCESLQNNLNNAAKLSILHRNLAGEGSHRHISSAISLHTHPESLSQLPTHFCEVIIIERLPSGVFADPFELQHLHQRGGKLQFVSFQ